MINENAILKTASVNDNPAADQIRIRINIINRDRDVLVCVSLLSNVLFYVFHISVFVLSLDNRLYFLSFHTCCICRCVCLC